MGCRIAARITAGNALRGTVAPGAAIGATIEKGGGPSPYSGEYTITPAPVAQVLETGGHVLLQDVTVEPIPSNYGLITWDGSKITVS